MVLICSEKQLKKRIKKWEKLGIDYLEFTKTLKSISELEVQLKRAVNVCNEQTEAIKKKKEEVRKAYQYLASQERVK